MTKNNTQKIEGIIERIGYDPESGAPMSSVGGRGSLFLVLEDDNNVYKCWNETNHVYEDIGTSAGEDWLLLLTQPGDHVTFELNPRDIDYPFLGIQIRSLRNWTLEKRLSHSLKDITPTDKSLPHSYPKLSSENS